MSAPARPGDATAAAGPDTAVISDWRVMGPQPLGAFVKADVTEQLVQLGIQLAAELWVTRRRLAAIEAQLVTSGAIVSPDQIEAAAEPEDHARRDEFIQRLFVAFLT
jgi:hypothetical protein